MKIKPADFDALKAAIEAQVKDLEEADPGCLARHARALRCAHVKDIGLRYRWDILWSVPASIRGPIIDRLYLYANDTHIDTALRAIIQTP